MELYPYPDCHHTIMEHILQIFLECDIKEFPIDCLYILKHYDYTVYTYGELKEQNVELYNMCISYSNDAFRWKNIIAYNEKQKYERIRFSLMHELGHIVLNHTGVCNQNEEEANHFASNMLAPRILIHKFNDRTADQIHDRFGLSYAASNLALQDYRDWYRHIGHTTRRPSAAENELEARLFSVEEGRMESPPVTPTADQPESGLSSDYLRITYLLNAGLEIPPDLKPLLNLYQKRGFSL